VLGPPKLNFNSTSRNQNRSVDNTDNKGTDGLGQEVTSPGRTGLKDKSFKSLEDDLRERDFNEVLGLRNRRDDDGWTNVRSARSHRNQDSDRWPRGERDRDRERINKDGEVSEAPLRRNGIGRGRVERSWREEASGTDSSRTMGGWRDRERDRERDRDRERERDAPRRGRFDQKVEEEPEWMLDDSKDEPAKQPRTQEDFQRWMETQKLSKANAAPAEDKAQTSSTTPEAAKQPKEPAPKSAPLMAGNAFGNMFGGWDDKKLDHLKSDVAAKPKMSKFFPKEATAQAPAPERPATASPAAADTPNTTDEDKEGFQRILHMLNSKAPSDASTSMKPPPQDHQAMHERAFPPPPLNGPQAEDADFLAEVLARQGLGRDVKSVPPPRGGPALPMDQEPAHQYFPPEFMHLPEGRGESMTPRNGAFGPLPEAGGPPGPGGPPLDHEREFLLSLMNSRPHQQHPRPPEAEPEEMYQRQQMQARSQPPPMMQGPPPGYWAPPTQQRRAGPQGPPNFPELDEPPMLGLQRRKTTDLPPRNPLSNMGIPSQHAPPPEWLKGGPAGMGLGSHGAERAGLAPPPGFGARAAPPFLNGPPLPPALPTGPLPPHPGLPRGAAGPSPPGAAPPGLFHGPPPGFFGPGPNAGMGVPPGAPPGAGPGGPPPPFLMMGPGGTPGGPGARGAPFADFPPLPGDVPRRGGNAPPGFPAL